MTQVQNPSPLLLKHKLLWIRRLSIANFVTVLKIVTCVKAV